MIRPSFARSCLLVALTAACANPAPQRSAATASADPPAPPPCANHITATRSDGTSVVYMGADPSDPGICLFNINGTVVRSVWGSWILRPFAAYNPVDVKEVVAKVRRGPVGTKAQISWPAGNQTNTTTWERLPDETVNVGSQSYICMVIHSTDNFGNEFLTWFDPKNLIPLHGKGNYPKPYDFHVTAIAPST